MIIVRNISKKYKSRLVVNQVSLEAEQGKIIGLLGPNGAGKTTCFYMILGIIPCDSGNIQLHDQDITHQPVHARAKMGISYLPQEPSVFRKLSVEHNILSIIQNRAELKTAQQQALLETLLQEFGLQKIRKSMGMSLSGGERRRVEIARALATDPSYILLDEPFAGIDPISIVEIKQIIKHLTERNIGVIITDHNVRETLDICDHAYIMNAGQVIATGDTASILANEQVRQVYLGDQFHI